MADDYEASLLAGQDPEEGRGADADWEDLKASLAEVTAVWRTRANSRRATWVPQVNKAAAAAAGGGGEGAGGGDDSSKSAEEGGAGRAEWRVSLGEALESTTTHVIIVALLLTDLLATAIDILKEIHTTHADLDACIERLASGGCPSEFQRTEAPWEWLSYVGIAILCVLLLNVLALLLAFGAAFFKHAGYVLDAVVVVTALYLEVFLAADTAGLLVILTLWRIVRVAHGIFEVTDEAWDKEVKDVEERVARVEAARNRDLELLRWRQHRIAELEAQLQDLQQQQQGQQQDHTSSDYL